MLRGVNKRIIEINDTGSEMFEKALFFVKHDNALSSSQLENEAKRMMVSYLSQEDKPHQGFLRYTDNKKKRRNRVFAISVLSVICCIGVAILLNIIL